MPVKLPGRRLHCAESGPRTQWTLPRCDPASPASSGCRTPRSGDALRTSRPPRAGRLAASSPGRRRLTAPTMERGQPSARSRCATQAVTRPCALVRLIRHGAEPWCRGAGEVGQHDSACPAVSAERIVPSSFRAASASATMVSTAARLCDRVGWGNLRPPGHARALASSTMTCLTSSARRVVSLPTSPMLTNRPTPHPAPG
mgnify:CR=1 FL=1